MDPAEGVGVDAFPRHAVEQSRGHHHVDQGTVRNGQERDRREEARRERRALFDHLEERAVRLGEPVRRDNG